METGYIYVIIVREFLNAKQNILKIGRTKDIYKRQQHYPKGSVLLFCKYVKNDAVTEKKIISRLNEKFTRRLDIGFEYYEGYSDKIVNCVEAEIISLEKNEDTLGVRLHYDCPETSMTHSHCPETSMTHLPPSQSLPNSVPSPTFHKQPPKIHEKHNNEIIPQSNEFWISSFYTENIERYDKKIVPSYKVYDRFYNWLKEKSFDKVWINHKMFTMGLKDMFYVISKTHRFGKSVCLALCFGNVDEVSNSCQAFLDNYVTPSSKNTDFLTLDQLNNGFAKSTYYDGSELKKKIVTDCLNIIPIHVYKSEKVEYRHVFMGLKFKDRDLNMEIEEIKKANANRLQAFVDKHIVKGNTTDFMTMKQLNDRLKLDNELYVGNLIDIKKLERILGVKCLDDKYINKTKYKKVFLNYKLRVNEISLLN